MQEPAAGFAALLSEQLLLPPEGAWGEATVYLPAFAPAVGLTLTAHPQHAVLWVRVLRAGGAALMQEAGWRIGGQPAPAVVVQDDLLEVPLEQVQALSPARLRPLPRHAPGEQSRDGVAVWGQVWEGGAAQSFSAAHPEAGTWEHTVALGLVRVLAESSSALAAEGIAMQQRIAPRGPGGSTALTPGRS